MTGRRDQNQRMSCIEPGMFRFSRIFWKKMSELFPVCPIGWRVEDVKEVVKKVILQEVKKDSLYKINSSFVDIHSLIYSKYSG